MWKPLSFLILLLSVSFVVEASNGQQEVDRQIVGDLAKRLQQFKSPDEALAALTPGLNEKEIKYFKDLISSKYWVEVPLSVKSDKNVLILEFSNKVFVNVEVANYWSGEFKVNGYQLSMNKYKSLEEEMSYLRRVVKSNVPELPKDSKKESKGAFLYSLIFPTAHASLTCNALVSSGCIEISMAASLWFVRTLASDSPLGRCKDIYYFNKLNDVTKKCLQDYKNNPTLVTIQEISEVLAAAPETSVEITCGKVAPTISIGGTEVVKLGRGALASDYSIAVAQDPHGKLRSLPELAIKCCRKNEDDPLSGKCEEFVSNHLGSRDKRKEEFKSSDLRIRGKAVPGVR